MTISARYLEYLDRLGPLVPLEALAADPTLDAIGLRHDVDHDLDYALDMAAAESDRGVRATYFLLHTAEYFKDPRFDIKVRQLSAYGHEIGLHLNLLTEWWDGEIDDIDHALSIQLERIRSLGVSVSGVSAHGDRRCYEKGFINYWCFRELLPDDPRGRENRLSAEGIPVSDPGYQIGYPQSAELRRPDGERLALWGISMAAHGLSYEASHLPVVSYYSDSGGGFTRTPDPLIAEPSAGPHQLLMHPIHWIAEPKRFFALSTARSGSTWLSHQVEQGSSIIGLHEHSLNHQLHDGALVARKRTGVGLVSLLKDRDELRRLLADAAHWSQGLDRTVLEANVYLAHVRESLADAFPDAWAFHLVRNPELVVRSIVARGWYEDELDQAHPRFELPGWGLMSQFERCCWYVRLTSDALSQLNVPVVRLEDLVGSRERAVERLRDFGITLHPMLLEGFEQPKNEGPQERAEWSALEQWRFRSICGPLQEQFGYPPLSATTRPPERSVDPRTLNDVLPAAAQPELKETLVDVESRWLHVGLDRENSSWIPQPDRHSYLLLGGGTWARSTPDSGGPAYPRTTIRGSCTVESVGLGTPTLFVLEFDADGAQTHRRRIADLDGQMDFAFKLSSATRRCNLAIYCRREQLPQAFEVTHFEFGIHQ